MNNQEEKSAEKPKQRHPFILANPNSLNKLGVIGITPASTGPIIPAPLFGPIPSIIGNNPPRAADAGTKDTKQNETKKDNDTVLEEDNSNSLFSSGFFSNLPPQNQVKETEQKKPDFPPPLQGMFSIALPNLGSSVAKDAVLKQPPNTATTAAPSEKQIKVNKAAFTLNSLESNAENYLKILSKQEFTKKHDEVSQPNLNKHNSEEEKSDEEPLPTGGPIKPGAGMFPLFAGFKKGEVMPTSNIFSGKPIILSNAQGANKPTIPVGGQQQFASFQGVNNESHGEIITNFYHTYNSIETLAPLVNQDEKLSLTLKSRNAKIFVNPNQNAKEKNLICFVETQTTHQAGPTSKDTSDDKKASKTTEVSNNISLLVNQHEQIPNVLSVYHSKGMLQGTILDFTIRHFRYLYLLYAKSITVLDLKDILRGSPSAEITIVESIILSQNPTQMNIYNYMEIAGANQEFIILFTDIVSKRDSDKPLKAAGVMHIDCSHLSDRYRQTHGLLNTQTVIDVQEGKEVVSIIDVEIWENKVSILFENSNIKVFDLSNCPQSVKQPKGQGQKKKPPKQEPTEEEEEVALGPKLVFLTRFADATEHISEMFYIREFGKVKDFDVFDDKSESDVSEDGPIEPIFLKGFFLLVESSKSSDKKKQFRKLHIVQVIHNSKKQGFEQIDQLTISEQTSKFVSYDPKRGIVFLLNKEKQDRHIKLFTVKLKKEVIGDSDSDKHSDDEKSVTPQSKLRFEYVTESRLQIGNTSFSAIQKVTQQKTLVQGVPAYLNVLNVVIEDEYDLGGEQYFVYTNILDQVLVFSRMVTDVTPSSVEIAKLISSGIKSAPVSATKIKHYSPTKETEADIFQRIKDDPFALPDLYKEKIFKQARELGYNDDSGASENGGEHLVQDLLDGLSEKTENKTVLREPKEQPKAEEPKAEVKEESKIEYVKQIQELIIKAKETIEEANLPVKPPEKKKPKKKKAKDAALKAEEAKKIAEAEIKPIVSQEPAPKQELEDSFETKCAMRITAKDKDRVKEVKESEKEKEKEPSKEPEKEKEKDAATVASPTTVAPVATPQPQPEKVFKKKETKATEPYTLKQQEEIIENFQELTRKYQELAQKVNQMGQQVKTQTTQKIEINDVIERAIKEALSLQNSEGLLTQAIKEIVVPILTQKMRSLDAQVKEQIVPQLETMIGNLFQTLIQHNEIQKMQSRQEQFSEEAVKKLVIREFRDAMSTQIVPTIEATLKKVLTNIEKPINDLNLALCEKLVEEEDRQESMMNYYQNSLERLLFIHQRMGLMSQQQLKMQIAQQISTQKELSMQLMEGPLQIQIHEMIKQQQQHIQHQMQGYIQQQVQQQVQMQMQQFNTPFQSQFHPFAKQSSVMSFGSPTYPPYQHQMSFNQPSPMKQTSSYAHQSEPQMPFDFPETNLMMQKLKSMHKQKINKQFSVGKSDTVEQTQSHIISNNHPPMMLFTGEETSNDIESEKMQRQMQARKKEKKKAKQETQKVTKPSPATQPNFYEELGAPRDDDSEGDNSVDDDDKDKEAGTAYADEPRISIALNEYRPAQRPYDDDKNADQTKSLLSANRGPPRILQNKDNLRTQKLPEPNNEEVKVNDPETMRQLNAFIDMKFETGRARQQKFEGFDDGTTVVNKQERQLQRHPFAPNDTENKGQSAPSLIESGFQQFNQAQLYQQPRELNTWAGQDQFQPFGLAGYNDLITSAQRKAHRASKQ